MKKSVFLSLSLLALLPFLVQRASNRFWPKTLSLIFFDVGQGDAILIQLPKGTVILVDTGGAQGNWDAGKAVLARELARLGILHLDHLVLTHPDLDHTGGAMSLLDLIPPKNLWINGLFLKQKGPRFKKLLLEAMKRGVRIQPIFENTSVLWDGIPIEMFPLKNGISVNDRCLVMRIAKASCRAILTGDIEKKGEEELFSLVRRAQVLKAPHHGSHTSSSSLFLERIAPWVTVVSVGRENQYGHPNSEVLNRYRRLGTQILRTDFHGFVTLSTDGLSWKCNSAMGSCGEELCGVN